MRPIFPYFHSQSMSLGGHSSVFFNVSADPPASWTNNVFHNSRYGIFCLSGGKLELISKGPNTAKFRKCKCNDEQSAWQKIQQWMDELS